MIYNDWGYIVIDESSFKSLCNYVKDIAIKMAKEYFNNIKGYIDGNVFVYSCDINDNGVEVTFHSYYLDFDDFELNVVVPFKYIFGNNIDDFMKYKGINKW